MRPRPLARALGFLHSTLEVIMKNNKLVLFSALVNAILLSTTAGAAGCSGYTCDGKDPVAMGCSSGAVTAASKKSTGVFWRTFVELRWSPTCKTNWTRISYENVTTTWDPNYDKKLTPQLLTATVYRSSNPKVSYTTTVAPLEATSWSPMVYGSGLCSYGNGTSYEKDFNLTKFLVSLTTAIKC